MTAAGSSRASVSSRNSRCLAWAGSVPGLFRRGNVSSRRAISGLNPGRQVEDAGDLLRVVADVEVGILGQSARCCVDRGTDGYRHEVRVEVGSELTACLKARERVLKLTRESIHVSLTVEPLLAVGSEAVPCDL